MKTTPTPSHPPRQTFLEWYHVATLGQTLQRLEGSYLRSSLKLTYNEKTLQVGYLGSETLYVDADFIGGFVLIEEGPTAAEIHGTFARGRAEALPVATESIDTVILPHVLEFASNPHQVLHEVARILKPEGRLFLLGLNPWSPEDFLRHLPRKQSRWRSRFVSSHRLLDWLNLLMFDAHFSAAFSLSSCCVFGRPTTLWARTRTELAFAYALKAIKRRPNRIPIEPCWVTLPSLATGQMFEKSCGTLIQIE